MENRAYAAAAGLFTLLLATGVVLVVLWFNGDTVETREFLLVSRYPVSGLNLQAPVRYRGVTVGKVTNIRFDPMDSRAVLVEIVVQSGTPLTRSAYAQLGSQGVTGLAYVILDDDGSKPELLASEDGNPARIEVRPSFMDSISASGQDMINNVNVVAQRVNTLLSDANQKQLLGTLRNLDSTLHNLDQVSARVASLASAMEPSVKALPALLSDGGVVLKRADTLLENVNQRVESFERAAKSVDQLGGSGIALSDAMMSESLPRFNTLLEDLQRSSRGLERLLYEINEQPHSFVFGKNPLPPGPGEPGFGTQGGKK